MGSAAWRLRAGVLVLVGALVVHELRYLLVGHHQDEHAHAYLPWLLAVACAVLVLAVAEFAARLVVRVRSCRGPRSSGGVRWLAVSSLLVGIFVGQEVGEQLLTHGHVDLVGSLVVDGAWIAVPLAFAVGAAIALVLRGASTLLARALEPRARRRRARAAARMPLLPPLRPRVSVLASHLAGRAPPLS